MEGLNYNSNFDQVYPQYSNYNTNQYSQVYYGSNYQSQYPATPSNNSNLVSNYYSLNFYPRENEQNCSPVSYYNYYNSSYNSNDSGYLTSSDQNSPCSVRTKLDYQIEEKPLQEQCTKKRKLENDILHDNIESIDQKKSNSKRPKVLKLQNLESKDVEYKCEICLNVFISAAKFLMHQFVHHKNGNSKQCPVCFRKFGSYSNAMVHLRGHTQEKLYQCKQCEKSFVDISTLKKHQRIHSGEKPFECHICFKKFSQSGNLTRHLTTHTEEIKTQSNVYSVSPNQTSDLAYNQIMNPSLESYVSNKTDYQSYNYTNEYNQYHLPQNYQFNYYMSY